MIQTIRRTVVAIVSILVVLTIALWAILGTAGLLSLFQEGKKYWETMAPIAAIGTSLWGVLQAYRAWESSEKGRMEAAKTEAQWNAPIQLILVSPEGKERVLPYEPARGQLTRAELLGILGIYGGKERFDANLLLTLLESGDLNKVTKGDTDTLRIPSSQAFWLQVDTEIGLRAAS